MRRRAAAIARLLQQGRVVRLRGGERVGADDLAPRIIAIAEAPGGRARRIVADERHLVRAPDLLEADRRIAPVIARVRPELAILVEILRREDVDRQRFDTWRCRTILRGKDRHVVRRNPRAGEHPLALGADDDLDLQRFTCTPARTRHGRRRGAARCHGQTRDRRHEHQPPGADAHHAAAANGHTASSHHRDHPLSHESVRRRPSGHRDRSRRPRAPSER